MWSTIPAGWLAITSGLIGALVAYGLGEWRERRARKRKLLGNFEALAAEILICNSLAEGYLAGAVLAPAYRMPIVAFETVLPALLAEGVLARGEIEAILSFYVNTKSFNLSLDLAQDYASSNKDNSVEREASRASLKAMNAIEGPPGIPSHYEKALVAVKKHLKRESITRLKLDVSEPAENLSRSARV